MSTFKPYAYFQCPCSDTSILANSSTPPDSPTHEEERTFDPRAPRANYSLYPLEHLLYYAQDPVFNAQYVYHLSQSMRRQSPKYPMFRHLRQHPIFFTVHTIKNGGDPLISAKERRRDRDERRSSLATETILEEADEVIEKHTDPNEKLDIESQYANLKSFYQGQLADSNPSSALGFSNDYGYGSPGALTRIMGLYTGGSFGDRKAKSKTASMREACDSTEGLQVYDPETESVAVSQLLRDGWEGTIATEQRTNQTSPSTRFLDSLRPIPCLLRTKRSKRCRTCRHILSKPESKPLPLQPAPSPTPAQITLTPLKPTQFLLTFKNPLFEPVKISLATKGLTTDRHASKVILLCPQFEVGANTDMWDEALQDSSSSAHDRKHSTATHGSMASIDLSNEAHGKPWDKGRNWTSVVVEVTPGKLKTKLPGLEQQRRLEEEVQKERVEEDADVCEIAVFVRVEWEADAAGDGDGAGKLGGLGDRDGREKRELAYWCVVGVGRIGK
ncbi:putative dynactin p62 family protein [Botrytis fragariae]|uniref:Dynactin subunit 4 n=1 Tax=Botrytis fragariae TaxID=1964551 RepID=A0A8H6AUR3_9HELO|nr:putative dynactin p62 family protein [Botrytis fragariae]KAF5873785.1 putative dynactin p62 family protein [Botrytis fragariae]